MPLYEFQCKKCGNREEKLCKAGEEGKELKCPKCGNVGLEKMVSGFAAPGVAGASKCGGCSGGSCSTC